MVVAKGLDGGKNKGKMEGLDGRKELGSETILVFGPESVSYERSRPIDRCILREISARVFFVKIPKINKNHISSISGIWDNWKNQIPNISRIELNQKNRFPIFPGLWRMLQTSISNISRIGINNPNPCSL